MLLQVLPAFLSVLFPSRTASLIPFSGSAVHPNGRAVNQEGGDLNMEWGADDPEQNTIRRQLR